MGKHGKSCWTHRTTWITCHEELLFCQRAKNWINLWGLEHGQQRSTKIWAWTVDFSFRTVDNLIYRNGECKGKKEKHHQVKHW
jgi:hypothetical protein